MKGRKVPPPIVFALPRANDPSLAIDTAFFLSHPEVAEYSRMYIRGETVEPMHPDTWVWVKLIGAERVRGFAPPSTVGRLN
jgi:hypothetical protein